MHPTTSTGWPAVAKGVRSIVLLAVATVLVSVAVGKVFAWSPVQNWHDATFDSIVDSLQSIPLLLGASGFLTDAGHTTVNFLMLLALAVVALVVKKTAALPWLLTLAAVAFFLRPFQSLITVMVDGTTPQSSLIEGTAGPYFSGGVFRVTVIFGVGAALLGLSKGSILLVALVAGSLEGLTRMVLGRHWPLDIVASVPIGLAALGLALLCEQTIREAVALARPSRSFSENPI